MNDESHNNYFAGVDIGSTMTKVVITGAGRESSLIGPTGPEHRKLANCVMEDALNRAGININDVTYIVATGYGRINVPFADRQVTEITCHAKGLSSLIPSARTVVDIGGQDSKGIRIENGKVVDFVMNDKCAAGTGRFLEIIADALGVALDRLGELSLTAQQPAAIGSYCSVFAGSDVLDRLREGYSREAIALGCLHSVAQRVIEIGGFREPLRVTGGVAEYFPGVIKAICQLTGMKAEVVPEPIQAGALGAAIKAHQAADLGAKRAR